MKKISFFILASLAFFACKEELDSPRASLSYSVERNGEIVENPDLVYAGEYVLFTSTGSGDEFAIYPGSPGFVYEKSFLTDSIASQNSNIVESKDKGYTMEKRNGIHSLRFKYVDHGECQVTFIATNISKDGSKTKTDINTDIKFSVLDTVGAITSIAFYSPSSLTKAKTVRDGNTINVMVPNGTKMTSFAKTSLAMNVGKGILLRNNVVIAPFKGLCEDNVNLNEPVVYVVKAPNGVEHSYTIQIKESAYVDSDANALTSIQLGGKTYSLQGDKFDLFYPSNATDMPVVFNRSPKSKVTLGGLAPKVDYTVSDLLASKNFFTVTSESGIVSKPYLFLLNEDVISFLPINFDGALGFPLTVDAGAKTIEFSLSSLFDKTAMKPLFTTSPFTAVSYEKEGNYISYSASSEPIDFSNPVTLRFVNGADTATYTMIYK